MAAFVKAIKAYLGTTWGSGAARSGENIGVFYCTRQFRSRWVLSLNLHIVNAEKSDQVQAALAEIKERNPEGVLLTSFFSASASTGAKMNWRA